MRCREFVRLVEFVSRRNYSWMSLGFGGGSVGMRFNGIVRSDCFGWFYESIEVYLLNYG